MIKTELITIGDELLYGQTIDTNAAFIGEKLASAGFDLVYHTTVADNLETMLNAISAAMNRADIIITTGGLGPTNDDITKKAICKYFKRQLVFHEDVLEKLIKKYAGMGITLPPVNQNQALLPQGAAFLENKIGTALGIVMEEHGKIFVSMPGVPSEMELMVTDQLLPFLQAKTDGNTIYHRKLKTIGITESAIYEKVKDLIDDKSTVSVAFLPSPRGVDIRLTAKSSNELLAKESVGSLEKKFAERIKQHIYGYDDNELPEITGRILRANDKTIAVAESCTGGMLGKFFTDVPGSSDYFLGGVIAYSNALKVKLLNVPPGIIDQYGAVSEQTAKAMAEGVKKITGADIALAITGIAGPNGGTDDKPVGLTYIGMATMGGVEAVKYNFGMVRERNRIRAAYYALDLVRRHLLENK